MRLVILPVKNGNGKLRINPEHVVAVWQANTVDYTGVLLCGNKTYEIALPIDQVAALLGDPNGLLDQIPQVEGSGR